MERELRKETCYVGNGRIIAQRWIDTERLKIFGGWLVRTQLNGAKNMVFVPDPEHKWTLADKK